jgi:hypothetical protein
MLVGEITAGSGGCQEWQWEPGLKPPRFWDD